MKVLLGNKVKDICKKNLEELIKGYKSIILDIGTGDGGFVYKNAKENPTSFYIGIDSNEKNMIEYSTRLTKKVTKGGLNNALYVLGNVENLPIELVNTCDKIFVNLPWGSLRDGLIKGEENILNNLKLIAKNNATAEICTTYSEVYEEKEIINRNLPELSLDYFSKVLKPKYKLCGLNIKNIKVYSNDQLKQLNTKWAKKLAYGRKREVYYYICGIDK